MSQECVLLINLDRTGANFFMTVDMIKDRLGAYPLVLQLPIGSGKHTFKGSSRFSI